MHLSHHAGRTHVGRVRKKNEDVYEIRASAGVALVADGMGGAACGEIASGMAAKTVCDYVETTPGLTPEELLVGAINAANACVWQASQGPGACDGMGTTLVIAYWRNGIVWLANVGDSRGYVLRDGVLEQLSYDQNLANDLRESLKLTDEQIASYPQRHALTMAVGTRADVRCRMYSG
jgi:PPM family protein phosphatase